LVGWAFHTYLSQKHTTSLLVPDKTPDFPTYHAHPSITQRCSVSCHAVIEQMVQYLTTILKIYKYTFRTTTQPSVAFRSDLLNICLSLIFEQGWKWEHKTVCVIHLQHKEYGIERDMKDNQTAEPPRSVSFLGVILTHLICNKVNVSHPVTLLMFGRTWPDFRPGRKFSSWHHVQT